jgi:methionyl-tRNA formyltransferase
MRLAIITSNGLRHRFVANTLAAAAGEALVITERPQAAAAGAGVPAPLAAHFAARDAAERDAFPGQERWHAPHHALEPGQLDGPAALDLLAGLRPDAAVVFGAPLIREPMLSALPAARTINIHLGLAPYYRGSGTNFWPFVNRELAYVGATLLHLNAGIDRGDIIGHVRAEVAGGDTVHTLGCRVIRAAAEAVKEVLALVEAGQPLPRAPQWPSNPQRYYRQRDFTEAALAAYRQALAEGLVTQFLQGKHEVPRLVGLPARRHAETA